MIAFLHRVESAQQQLPAPVAVYQPIRQSVEAQVSTGATQRLGLSTPFPCRVTECGQVYTSDDERRCHERTAHGLSRVPSNHCQLSPQSSTQPQLLADDHVFNYSTNLMTMALLERDFQDAVREMDGARLLRLWKLKMLYFKSAGRSKYALEAPLFQADQLALLSPWDAYRQLWNRGFNLSGGAGNNIALDLMVEHNNLFIKEMIGNQGANVTFKSSQQVSRASMQLEAVLSNLDSILGIPKSMQW